MHRDSLLNQLNAYRERWPDEGEEADRFMSFVERCPDCFERGLREGHVTAAGWLVNSAGTHVLLTHHRKLDRWLQLGGHADGEADVLRVARKEVEEESGLHDFVRVGAGIFDLDIHAIPEHQGVPEHFHYDVRFAFQVTGSEDYVVSDESHDLEWVDIDRLDAVTREHSMLRMAEKWKDARASDVKGLG